MVEYATDTVAGTSASISTFVMEKFQEEANRMSVDDNSISFSKMRKVCTHSGRKYLHFCHFQTPLQTHFIFETVMYP
ncbi:BTE_collapsed_G0004210.mRNA.1.CDS.1 [Saccharomyces cerevisiae]|nr:BTE_collapsed_G0004210.mRNA.1.CDS.1 [Saccharomyces cerevisiae]